MHTHGHVDEKQGLTQCCSHVPACRGHRNSPEVPDCIHYCNPGAPQNWLAQLMLAVAVNTKPLSGEVADRRCLWGTAVVYDEGEKGAQ